MSYRVPCPASSPPPSPSSVSLSPGISSLVSFPIAWIEVHVKGFFFHLFPRRSCIDQSTQEASLLLFVSGNLVIREAPFPHSPKGETAGLSKRLLRSGVLKLSFSFFFLLFGDLHPLALWSFPCVFLYSFLSLSFFFTNVVHI